MTDLEILAEHLKPRSAEKWHELLDRLVNRTQMLETFPRQGQNELLLSARNPAKAN